MAMALERQECHYSIANLQGKARVQLSRVAAHVLFFGRPFLAVLDGAVAGLELTSAPEAKVDGSRAAIVASEIENGAAALLLSSTTLGFVFPSFSACDRTSILLFSHDWSSFVCR